MRKVARFESAQKAETFRWFLISEKIDTRHEDLGESSTEVWVFHDRDLPKARGFLEEFESADDTKRFQSAADKEKKKWLHKIAKAKAATQPKVRSLPLRQANLTYTLITASTLFYVLQSMDKANFLASQMILSSRFLKGEVWRLITPIFLHFDFFHILFNMLWLFQLGRVIEESIGTLKYLLLILLVSVFSNLAFYYLVGPMFGGMSGVVYGLFYYMWARDRYSLVSPFRMDPFLFKFFTGFYVFCWLLSAVGVHIANTVHGVGGFVGVAMGYLASGAFQRIRKPYRFDKVAAYNIVIMILLVAGGIFADILTL